MLILFLAVIRECFPTSILLGSIENPVDPTPVCSPEPVESDTILACICTSDLCNILPGEPKTAAVQTVQTTQPPTTQSSRIQTTQPTRPPLTLPPTQPPTHPPTQPPSRESQFNQVEQRPANAPVRSLPGMI